METPKGVNLQKNEDGSVNKNYVDLLDEDKPIAGQKFACLSFVSPEQIIKQREMFYFENFVKHWDFHKSMEKFRQFVNFISFKYKIDLEKINEDMTEFCDSEKDNLVSTTCLDEYKSFVDAKEEPLTTEFDKRHEFQTSTRGVKVRGVFPSQEEAEMRCKMLRQLDPNHDVYVGEVGLWMPFHPEAYKTGRVEYMEETLNQLMSEKKKNEKEAKVEFDKRVMEAKEKAIEDNIKKAEASGNKLSQTLNEQGSLVSVATEDGASSTFGIPSSEDKMMTSDDIQKSIFDVGNVVMDKHTDHGVSAVMNNTVAVEQTVAVELPVIVEQTEADADEMMEVASVD